VGQRLQTIVKAHYSRGDRASLSLAKRHVRYAVHRTTERGQSQYRDVYDRDGRLSKLDAYERLDQAGKRAYVYRLTLSPHPERQDREQGLDLQAWARDVMGQLDEAAGKPVEWFAVTHHNADHRHVHVVAISPGRLEAGHFSAMREAGDVSAQAQQRELAVEQQPTLARRGLEASW